MTHRHDPERDHTATFNVMGALASAGVEARSERYGLRAAIFRQGDPCDDIRYIESGRVKLSVMSTSGREAVVGVLGAGDFFGEGCLVGQPVRTGTATTLRPSAILCVPKQAMIAVLHQQHGMSDRFIAHVLARHIRMQEDMLDQLFHSAEQRLARTLLLLAGDDDSDQPGRVIAGVSQATLAAMIGTTRSRVNVFLQRFKQCGFIEYPSGEAQALTIHPSLRHAVDE